MNELKYEEITSDILSFLASEERREFARNSSKRAHDESQNVVRTLLVSPEVMKFRIGV